jgi:hypothetical protein
MLGSISASFSHNVEVEGGEKEPQDEHQSVQQRSQQHLRRIDKKKIKLVKGTVPRKSM